MRGELAFFRASPEFDNYCLRDCRDTAPRRSRQAGQRSITVARKEVRRPQGARARRSSVQGHRADPGLDDLPRRLRRHGEISVGDAAVDRDRLDQLPGVRADHVAGDDAGFAAVCAADRPARAASDARRWRCWARRCSSSPACGSCRSRKPPPPASSRRCSSPRCRSSFSARRSACGAGSRPRSA